MTSIFHTFLEAKTESAFRFHVGAEGPAVQAYNESNGEIGYGPDIDDLKFDMKSGSLKTPWNYACAILILQNADVDRPETPVSQEEYIEYFFQKLKRCKTEYNKGQPKIINGVLETMEDVLIRLGVTDAMALKRARANTRRVTVCLHIYVVK